MGSSRVSSATPPANEVIDRTLPTRRQLIALTTAAALAGVLLWTTSIEGWRMATLSALGILLGLTLYLTAFGFTAAYRNLLVRGETAGVRAQLLMLAAATLIFAPVLAAGSIFGQEVTGALAPVGVPVAIGAFMFGAGMQLAGGCGSGTLYTAGGGNPRMIVVLVAFCAGSFWASLHMGWWAHLPSWNEIALGERLGWPSAVLVQLGALGLIWMLLARWSRAADSYAGGILRLKKRDRLLLIGGLTLAVLNLLVLVVAGHPWTITWAFALWGAKAAQAAGWDPSGAPFWNGAFQQQALAGGALQDVTSVMDIGIMIGAFAGAAFAGRFAPRFDLSLRMLAAAVIGGLVMGYGARIAYGCNIGAFFSGVASTSLHGWLWIAAALPGTWLGVRLRPWFGLRN
ncbi:MAG: YeeE/YedE family protein [Betaproteobacteria bacterium]|nr:YeeE/YedE family protein [Betaproteobacteria bacterium]